MLNRTSKADVDRARREELMSELIDVETREVSMSVLADREVYDLEMKHIFAKTWLMLAHQTEIPESGDYVVRDMGEDQEIGRAHVRTPVTNAHLVCRLLLEKQKTHK